MGRQLGHDFQPGRVIHAVAVANPRQQVVSQPLGLDVREGGESSVGIVAHPTVTDLGESLLSQKDILDLIRPSGAGERVFGCVEGQPVLDAGFLKHAVVFDGIDPLPGGLRV